MIKEHVFKPTSGWIPLVVNLGLFLAVPTCIFMGVALLDRYSEVMGALLIPIGIFCGLGGILMLFGFQAVAPNDARVLLLFGNYKGSVMESGFYWVNPFYSKRKVTLRVRNFETGSITTPEQKDQAGKIIQQKTRTAGRPSKVNDRVSKHMPLSRPAP